MKLWVASLLLGIVYGQCRFALNYTGASIFKDKHVRSSFFLDWITGEIPFMKNGGFDSITGLTLDGQRLEVTTGLPYGPPHNFTAPSKESVHVGVLALVLDDNAIAGLLYTKEEALQLLALKIKSYNQFAHLF